MESKKINQLATAVNPSSSDLAIIGDPVTGVSKKITWLQVSTLIGTAANLQQVTDNGSTTTNPITIGGLTITGLSTGVLKSDSGVISSVPFGAANGVATLAGDGKVPSSQLPSYVDDVVEVANYAALPVTGETGKIYITLDNNKVYRWGGSVYVEVAANQAVWGSITGTLANQTDLQNALNLKANDSAVVHLAGTETITGTKTFSNPSKNDGGILLQNGSSYSLSGYMNLGGMTDGLRFTSGGGISNFFTLPSSVGYTYTFPALSGTIVAISGGNSTQYIDGTGALQTFPTLLSSDNLVKLVRNQSGATMAAGTIVYISGATGNKPLITKALATSDSTSAQTYGLVQADIANNADGYVVVIGNITDIDTSALTEGQQLYLSGTTAGAYTTTKPYAPIHLVYIGIVLRSHPTQGIIGVKIQNGYELDELHDVSAQSPSNNDGIFFNTSTSLWEKKSIATALGFTPISLASLSATSPLSYNNSTGAFSIQVATASQNGYLSSTDWSTFNNKQAALGGTGFVKISGSTISYDNSTYYLASNPSGFITLASLSAGAGISYSNITGVISSTITQYTDALARAAISSSATGLTYTSATGVFSLTAGYAIPTTAKQTEWDTAYTNRITSLTTTGSSGAATLVSNTLNVPTYTLSGLGGQPLDADLTAIAGLSGTSGFLKKNAADTWSLDTNTYVTTTTAQTISGAKTFSASPIIDGGFATAIPLRFKQYDSASFNSDGYTDLYVMNAYRFGFAFNQGSSNYKGFTFNVNGITLNTSREYTMPDAAGTLALTSDIPSLANYVTLNGTQTISGNKTFSGVNSFTGATSFSYATTFMNGTSLNWTAAGSHTGGTLTLSSAHSGSTSSLILSDGDTAKYIYFSFTNTATGIKTYTLPDTSGTLSLTSDLGSYVTLATNQTISAIKKYTDYQQFDNGIKFKSDGLGMSLVSGYVSVSFNASSTNHYLALASSVTSPVYYTYEFPNAAGTLALTSDIPSLSGYVPYSGATGAVSLGAYGITARTANITSTGGSDAVIIYSDGTYGGGIGLNYGTNPNHMVLYYNGATALKINTSQNATFGGTATATALTAQTAATGVGRITLNSGDATHSGYVNWFNSSVTRLGYMGYNNTDIELTLEGSTNFRVTGGAAIFSSSISAGTTITAQSGYFAQDVVGDPTYLRVRNLNTGGYSSAMALSLYGYSGTAAYYDVLTIRASYPGYGKVDFLVKGQSTSTNISALSIDATNGAASFYSSITANGNLTLAASVVGIVLNDTSGSAAGSIIFQNNGTQKFNLTTLATSNNFALYNNGGTNSYNLLIAHSTGAATFSSTIQANGGTILSNGGAYGIIQVKATSSQTWQMFTNASDELRFGISGVGDFVTFKNSGSVGIGTSTPGDKLHISGTYDSNIRLTDTGVANADWSLLASSGNSVPIFRLYNRATTITCMTWATSGNVGIGTSAPNYLLDLKKAHASGYGNFVTLINLNGHFPGYDVDAQRAGISAGCPNMGNTTYGMIGFETRGSDGYLNRMTINGTGNILVGHNSENSFGSARSIQINGSGGSLLETRYNGTSGVRIGSGSDHAYMHDPRNAEMRFATSDSTRFYIYGNGNYSFTGSNVSDRRAKDNISLLDITATDKIMSLEAKTYNMKNNPSQKRYGFIAQEVKQIISDLVSGNENDGYLGLDYDGLLTLTIKALQEQQKEIQILKQK